MLSISAYVIAMDSLPHVPDIFPFSYTTWPGPLSCSNTEAIRILGYSTAVK